MPGRDQPDVVDDHGHSGGAAGLNLSQQADVPHSEHIPMREFVFDRDDKENQYDVLPDPRPVGGVRPKIGQPDLPPKKSESVFRLVQQSDITRGMRAMFGVPGSKVQISGAPVETQAEASRMRGIRQHTGLCEASTSDDVRDILEPRQVVSDDRSGGIMLQKIDGNAGVNSCGLQSEAVRAQDDAVSVQPKAVAGVLPVPVKYINGAGETKSIMITPGFRDLLINLNQAHPAGRQHNLISWPEKYEFIWV